VKNNITLFLFGIFNISIFGQINSLVASEMLVYSKNFHTKFVIVNCDDESAIKTLQSNLSKHNDLKSKGKKMYLEAKAFTAKGLSEKKGDLYAHVSSITNGTEIKSTSALGYDIFLNEMSYFVEFNLLETAIKSGKTNY